MARRDLTFRVFVSSTFSDLVAERNALQERTFPRLRQYCQERGARFQAIDLRWGVSEEASRDQQTMNICLQELKRCQSVSPRPNFIVLLGDRYGWRPLPPQIPADERERLLTVMDHDEQAVVAQWYQRDDNAVPPEYVLQPRTGDFEDRRRWSDVETRLHNILFRAAQSVLPPNDESLNKYQDSATHQEIRHGALSVEHPQDHVFAYLRTIQRLPEDDRAKVYRDMTNWGADTDSDACLSALKDELRHLLPADHVYQFLVRWQMLEGETPSESPLSQDHLQALCDRVENDLRGVIDRELAAFQRVEDLDREIKTHEAFSAERVKNFTGRGDVLREIHSYLGSNDNRVLIIHGAAGSGRTALVARTVELARTQCPTAAVIVRFIGVTPDATAHDPTLSSICQQILSLYGHGADVTSLMTISPVRGLQRALQKASSQKPLVLFLDALDQLPVLDQPKCLSWLIERLPEHVHLIVSDSSDKYPSESPAPALPMRLVRLDPMSTDEGERLLDLWLNEAGRTLQDDQRDCVLRGFQQTPLPLFLRLTFEEARLWKSYQSHASVNTSISGVIDDLLKRLESPVCHGRILVSMGLSYLAGARNGLSEDELLDLLSNDEEVMEGFRHHSKHHLPGIDQSNPRLPVVVWARLYSDLRAYLSECPSDGTTLMSFRYRQLTQLIVQKYMAGSGRDNCQRKLMRYFDTLPLMLTDVGEKKVNHRKLAELPWLLAQLGSWRELSELLGGLPFLDACWKTNPDDVLRYWTLVEANSSCRMVDTYVPYGAYPEEYDVERLQSLADLLRQAGHWCQCLRLYNYLETCHRRTDNILTLSEVLAFKSQVFQGMGYTDQAVLCQAEMQKLAERAGSPWLASVAEEMHVDLLDTGTDAEERLKLLKESAARRAKECDRLVEQLAAAVKVLTEQHGAHDANNAISAMKGMEQCKLEGVARSLHSQARLLIEQRRWQDARQALSEATRLLTQLADVKGLIQCLALWGCFFDATGKPLEAIDAYSAAEGMCLQSGNLAEQAQIMGNRAVSLWQLKERARALEVLKTAEGILHSLHLNKELAECLNNHARLLINERMDAEEALRLASESKLLALGQDMGDGLGTILATLAEAKRLCASTPDSTDPRRKR